MPFFQIDSAWAKDAAVGICTRNGIILKDVVARAEQGRCATIENDTTATMFHLIHELNAAIGDEISNYTRANGSRMMMMMNVAAPSGAGGRRVNPHHVERLNETERMHCKEFIVRVAITGALAAFQRASGKCVYESSMGGKAAAAEGDEEEAPQSPIGEEERPVVLGEAQHETAEQRLERSVQTTLFKGLLYAFEAFQESHSMNRDHYPPRKDNNTPGTVGWDTLVLLYCVHRIPQIARHACGQAIDESVGQLIRTWRKLLVALQSVDAEESPEHSRRRGALSLVNGLLIILFQRYNTHQCAVLLDAVAHAENAAKVTEDPSKSIIAPSKHMVSEVITYYYYLGRMRLYERRLEEAYEALRQAYELLPPAGRINEPQRLNKQRVRFFLCVAGVANGRRIPDEILHADGDLLPTLFGGLIAAMEAGDAVRYTAALDAHGSVFFRRGVYLILQQAKILCHLMVVARVHAAMAQCDGVDNSRITVATLLAAYAHITKPAAPAAGSSSPPLRSKRDRAQRELENIRLAGTGGDDEVRQAEGVMDADRMALWIAKLISRGYMRGYYSHEHHTLVLSKKAPFPLLSQGEQAVS